MSVLHLLHGTLTSYDFEEDSSYYISIWKDVDFLRLWITLLGQKRSSSIRYRIRNLLVEVHKCLRWRSSPSFTKEQTSNKGLTKHTAMGILRNIGETKHFDNAFHKTLHVLAAKLVCTQTQMGMANGYADCYFRLSEWWNTNFVEVLCIWEAKITG